MCGIYGTCGKVRNKATLLRALCILNESRGKDSAGLGTVSYSGQHRVFKRAARPTKVVEIPKFNEIVQNPDNLVVLGHTRWATRGEVVRKNAHPFRFGSTLGVHNGTVHNVKQLTDYCGRSFAVDSQYLIYMLDKFGTLGPAAGETTVAYSKQKDWADLRIIRAGRPMAWAKTKDLRGFVFSSSRSHLQKALLIAGVEIAGRIHDMFDYESVAVYVTAKGRVEVQEQDADRLFDWETDPVYDDDRKDPLFKFKSDNYRYNADKDWWEKDIRNHTTDHTTGSGTTTTAADCQGLPDYEPRDEDAWFRDQMGYDRDPDLFADPDDHARRQFTDDFEEYRLRYE